MESHQIGVLVDKSFSGNHFGVKPSVLCYEASKRAVMVICPIHHRGDAEAKALVKQEEETVGKAESKSERERKT